MNEQMTIISKTVLKDCLGLQEQETFLVVTDDSKKDLASSLYEAGKALGAESILLVMKEREKSGQEPPSSVATAMTQANVVVCITEHSLTHTHARKNAAAAGARLATMPGITEDMFLQGAISADYSKVKELTERVTEFLTKGNNVRIQKGGYTLSFCITDRKGIPSTGMYLNPGESGNLPSGESYIAPVEGTASGQVLIDGSVAGIGRLQSPLLLNIEQGRIVGAEGEAAEELMNILGDSDGRLLGEFGIGTNDKARITGVVLEDEKVYGTIHVAFGSNNTFGGTISAGVHIDGVVIKPDIYIDEQLIMKNGQLNES
ncbi:aminopeptidase [Fictibacillus sp. FJAT-27399]|uniref:aminopeptidase n=1 Tax=Fictibacillus sp. FJAT-27399 TaxID=1729689 RepID=UPI000783A2D7|nr:aminopeptidase [Fictibacillus sp. FJAT-27399]